MSVFLLAPVPDFIVLLVSEALFLVLLLVVEVGIHLSFEDLVFSGVAFHLVLLLAE